MNIFTCLRPITLIVFACAVCIPSPTRAETQTTGSRPFLSPIFAEHMVLQRDKPNRFWGWTEPGKKVSMEIGGHSASAVAGADHKWHWAHAKIDGDTIIVSSPDVPSPVAAR